MVNRNRTRSTYLPGDVAERQKLAEIKELLMKSELASADERFDEMISHGDFSLPVLSVPGESSPIPLTPELAHVLLDAATQLLKGRGVTIIPRDMKMTTQEAADLLGMSRPTFVKILEAGDIAYEKVGRHRRVQLADVLAYQAAQHGRVMSALDSLGENEDPLAIVDNPLIRS